MLNPSGGIGNHDGNESNRGLHDSGHGLRVNQVKKNVGQTEKKIPRKEYISTLKNNKYSTCAGQLLSTLHTTTNVIHNLEILHIIQHMFSTSCNTQFRYYCATKDCKFRPPHSSFALNCAHI